MADKPSHEIAKIGAAAALSALDPTGGVGVAMMQHVATTMTQDAAWRRHTQDLWVDVLLEEKDKRRQEYERTESEFDRHRKLIEWLQDELGGTRDRVDALEAVALHLVAQSEELLRARPEPEMRPYLVAAYSNAVRSPGRFRATWVRRLTEHLRELGADHLAFLVERMEHADPQGKRGYYLSRTPERWLNGDPEGLLVFQDLLDKQLIERAPAGTNASGVYLTLVGGMLAKFVGAPEPTTATRRPASTP